MSVRPPTLAVQGRAYRIQGRLERTIRRGITGEHDATHNAVTAIAAHIRTNAERERHAMALQAALTCHLPETQSFLNAAESYVIDTERRHDFAAKCRREGHTGQAMAVCKLFKKSGSPEKAMANLNRAEAAIDELRRIIGLARVESYMRLIVPQMQTRYTSYKGRYADLSARRVRRALRRG